MTASRSKGAKKPKLAFCYFCGRWRCYVDVMHAGPPRRQVRACAECLPTTRPKKPRREVWVVFDGDEPIDVWSTQAGAETWKGEGLSVVRCAPAKPKRRKR